MTTRGRSIALIEPSVEEGHHAVMYRGPHNCEQYSGPHAIIELISPLTSHAKKFNRQGGGEKRILARHRQYAFSCSVEELGCATI